MSASEKLKELDAATPLEKYEIDLFGVLPQIVAVVEAAEAEHENSQLVNDEAITLGRALADLDEALS